LIKFSDLEQKLQETTQEFEEYDDESDYVRAKAHVRTGP